MRVENGTYLTAEPEGGEVKKIQNIEEKKLIYTKNRLADEGIRELAENIDQYGLQFPLVVIRADEAGDGMYEVIDGRRRLKALQTMVRLTEGNTIPCIVLTKKETSKDLSLILNTYRLDFNPMELYRIAVRYVEGELKGDPLALPPERIKDVAAKLNLDIHATCRILNIGRLDEEARNLVGSKKIPLRLALITLRISSKTGRKKFLKRCIEERPSTSQAIGWLKYDIQSTPNRQLNYASFDVLGECVKCRHRGYQDKSLFDDISKEKEKWGKDFCWNASCYEKKEKTAWQEAFKEAKEKLGLAGIKKYEGYMEGIPFKKVKAVDPEQCKKCKQVKLTKQLRHSDDIIVFCPISCANIKQRKKADAPKKKVTKKDPKDFTDEDKKTILEERFGLAARKVMIEHFFVEGSKGFVKGKEPVNYKRILFFVGCDANKNPFDLDARGFYAEVDFDKTEKQNKKIIDNLDLEKVAKINIWDAAQRLHGYDVSSTTPEDIDDAIVLLFGTKKWCKRHYAEIAEKLSKRSRKFLVDIEPWKPSWA